MTYVLFASSLLSMIGVTALAYGYRASMFSGDPATKWFARSMALLAVAIFARRLAWDIIHPIVVPGSDQRPINIVINVVTLIAVYAGLRARLMLIPEPERSRWRWYNSWAHPSLWKLRVDRPIAEHETREDQPSAAE